MTRLIIGVISHKYVGVVHTPYGLNSCWTVWSVNDPHILRLKIGCRLRLKFGCREPTLVLCNQFLVYESIQQLTVFQLLLVSHTWSKSTLSHSVQIHGSNHTHWLVNFLLDSAVNQRQSAQIKICTFALIFVAETCFGVDIKCLLGERCLFTEPIHAKEARSAYLVNYIQPQKLPSTFSSYLHSASLITKSHHQVCVCIVWWCYNVLRR